MEIHGPPTQLTSSMNYRHIYSPLTHTQKVMPAIFLENVPRIKTTPWYHKATRTKTSNILVIHEMSVKLSQLRKDSSEEIT